MRLEQGQREKHPALVVSLDGDVLLGNFKGGHVIYPVQEARPCISSLILYFFFLDFFFSPYFLFVSFSFDRVEFSYETPHGFYKTSR